jgi:hypothetical protein
MGSSLAGGLINGVTTLLSVGEISAILLGSRLPNIGPVVDLLNICRGPLSRNRDHHKLLCGGPPSRAYSSQPGP